MSSFAAACEWRCLSGTLGDGMVWWSLVRLCAQWTPVSTWSCSAVGEPELVSKGKVGSRRKAVCLPAIWSADTTKHHTNPALPKLGAHFSAGVRKSYTVYCLLFTTVHHCSLFTVHRSPFPSRVRPRPSTCFPTTVHANRGTILLLTCRVLFAPFFKK